MTDIQTQRTLRSTHRYVVVIGAVIPLAIALLATVIMLSWLPQLPDPVAVHWSGGGADGYGSPWLTILMPLGISAAFSAFAVVFCWRGTPGGRLLWAQKILLATAVFLSVLLSIIAAGTLAIQRGLDDATEAGEIGMLMLLAFGAAIVLAVLAWFVLPEADRLPNATSDVTPIEASGTEQLFWSATVTIARPAAILAIGSAVVLVVVLAVVATLDLAAALAPALIGAVVLIVALSTLFWRVTVDRRGLRARGAFGWPRVTIPSEDITGVAIAEVRAVGDFGGYGWRMDGNGRSGIILRSGRGIEVTRRNGRRFVLVADDAETGAAALATITGV